VTVFVLRWQISHGIEGSITGSRHALSFVLASSGRGEVDVALGFFVVKLRQELRHGALRPPRARKQRTSKYVRWNGVFIYRTVESVRRRSYRHRNSAVRPHGNGDFMLRRGTFLHCVRCDGDPLFFSFLLSSSRHSLVAVIAFRLPSSLCLHLCGRCHFLCGVLWTEEGKLREPEERPASFSRSFRSYIPREEAHRSSRPPRLSHGRHIVHPR